MPRRTVGALGALLLIPAIALAACGGGTPAASGERPVAPSVEAPEATEATSPEESPATGGGVDGTLTPGTTLSACEIVTTDDIAAATKTNGTVAAGILEASPTVLSPARTECTYEGDYGRIIVELTPDDGENLFDAAVGAYKDAAPIAGIGDGAFNSDDNHRAFVWKDKVTVMLTMFVGGGLTQLDVATDLGNAILAKL
jgi:hypothetical protein